VSFDRIACSYQLLETIAFGNALQRARTYWIDKIPTPNHALIVGEGNGRFLCELVRRHPKIDIDCVDTSQRMLELARARLLRTHPESPKRIRFLQQDILTWSLPNLYDLVVTHFFLDCFPREEVEQIVQKLGQSATPEAVWLIADFTIPSKRFARTHARLWLRGMYSFFQITAGITAKELVDPAPCLREKGFVCASSRLFRAGMLKSDLYRRDVPTKRSKQH
jgi:ubiquinone/menaquinone biosynthesis C-methylase UbiE